MAASKGATGPRPSPCTSQLPTRPDAIAITPLPSMTALVNKSAWTWGAVCAIETWQHGTRNVRRSAPAHGGRTARAPAPSSRAHQQWLLKAVGCVRRNRPSLKYAEQQAGGHPAQKAADEQYIVARRVLGGAGSRVCQHVKQRCARAATGGGRVSRCTDEPDRLAILNYAQASIRRAPCCQSSNSNQQEAVGIVHGDRAYNCPLGSWEEALTICPPARRQRCQTQRCWRIP